MVKHRFEHLRRWGEYAEEIAKAAKDMIPEVRVYVFGSIVEGKTAIYSDIGILVAIPSKKLSNEEKEIAIHKHTRKSGRRR